MKYYLYVCFYINGLYRSHFGSREPKSLGAKNLLFFPVTILAQGQNKEQKSLLSPRNHIFSTYHNIGMSSALARQRQLQQVMHPHAQEAQNARQLQQVQHQRELEAWCVARRLLEEYQLAQNKNNRDILCDQCAKFYRYGIMEFGKPDYNTNHGFLCNQCYDDECYPLCHPCCNGLWIDPYNEGRQLRLLCIRHMRRQMVPNSSATNEYRTESSGGIAIQEPESEPEVGRIRSHTQLSL